MTWYDELSTKDILWATRNSIEVEHVDLSLNLKQREGARRYAVATFPAWSLSDVIDLIPQLLHRISITAGPSDRVFDQIIEGLRALVGCHVTVDGEEAKEGGNA